MTAASASHRLLNFVQSALLRAHRLDRGDSDRRTRKWSPHGARDGRGSPVCAPLPLRLLLSTYQAQRLTGRDAPGLVAALAELARRSGLQRAPALYRVPSRLPNAFGLGRPEDSAICVTHGLLDQLDGENSPGFWRMRSGISPTATCGS